MILLPAADGSDGSIAGLLLKLWNHGTVPATLIPYLLLQTGGSRLVYRRMPWFALVCEMRPKAKCAHTYSA